jgi:hypothetical protein
MIWTVSVLAIVGFFWIWKTLNGPVWNDIPDPRTFARMLRILMYHGIYLPSHHATLTIRLREDRTRWLRFTKTMDARGRPGFVASYPRTGATAPFYDALRADLARRAVPFREQSAPAAPVLHFDFQQDIGGAYVVTQSLCRAWGARLHDDAIGLLVDTVWENVPRLTGLDHPVNEWLS